MILEKIAALFGGFDRAILAFVCVCAIWLTWFAFFRLMRGIVLFVKYLAGTRARKKRRRAEKARRLQFTLPKEGNSYVRARLHTTLRTDLEGECLEEETNAGVQLDYAQKLLSGVKEAALAPVERLDVEEMAGLISLYDHKERWTGEDRKAVNELLARLLKLSAKYEVAV